MRHRRSSCRLNSNTVLSVSGATTEAHTRTVIVTDSCRHCALERACSQAHPVMGVPPFRAGAWKDSAAVSGVAEAATAARGALGATVPRRNDADEAERAPMSPLAL